MHLHMCKMICFLLFCLLECSLGKLNLVASHDLLVYLLTLSCEDNHANQKIELPIDREKFIRLKTYIKKDQQERDFSLAFDFARLTLCSKYSSSGALRKNFVIS